MQHLTSPDGKEPDIFYGATGGPVQFQMGHERKLLQLDDSEDDDDVFVALMDQHRAAHNQQLLEKIMIEDY